MTLLPKNMYKRALDSPKNFPAVISLLLITGP